jgi:hypothetical protein
MFSRRDGHLGGTAASPATVDTLLPVRASVRETLALGRPVSDIGVELL